MEQHVVVIQSDNIQIAGAISRACSTIKQEGGIISQLDSTGVPTYEGLQWLVTIIYTIKTSAA